MRFWHWFSVFLYVALALGYSPISRAQNCHTICIIHKPWPFSGCVTTKRVCGPGIPPEPPLPPILNPETKNQCFADFFNCAESVLKQITKADLIQQCRKNFQQCPKYVINSFPAELAGPIVDDYIVNLRIQSNNKRQNLPTEFISSFQKYFPTINLGMVTFSTNINTIHGQAITIGEEIFFPDNPDFESRSGRELMLHELRHVVQYQNKGGIKPFLSEYFLHAAGKVIQNRNFNVHDAIGTERDAAQFASQTILQYGRAFFVRNKCTSDVDLSLLFWDGQDWTTTSFMTLTPGTETTLLRGNELMHSAAAQFGWYGVEADGDREWSGTHNFLVDGETYAFRVVDVITEDEYLTASILCGNADDTITLGFVDKG